MALHDLAVDFLVRDTWNGDLTAVHAALLDAYRGALHVDEPLDGARVPRDGGHLARHAAWHFLGAGRGRELAAL